MPTVPFNIEHSGFTVGIQGYYTVSDDARCRWMGITVPGSKALSILCDKSSGLFRKSRFLRSRGLSLACAERSSSILRSITILHHLKERIRPPGVEYLVAVHYSYEVFGVGEVDDVVGVAGEHVDALDVVAGDFELDDFAFGVVEVALLDKAVTAHHDEELPLGVVPVLAFGDARLRNVNRNLTAIQGVNQLGKRASVVHIHL